MAKAAQFFFPPFHAFLSLLGIFQSAEKQKSRSPGQYSPHARVFLCQTPWQKSRRHIWFSKCPASAHPRGGDPRVGTGGSGGRGQPSWEANRSQGQVTIMNPWGLLLARAAQTQKRRFWAWNCQFS